MSDHDVSLAIVRAIIAMCSSLSIATVAEGVETTQQLERLNSEGCTEAQGYLFGRPRSAADVKKWLAAFTPPVGS
jgi:EAL domain-containing protein (putative c-di-GMP-specific phosphodiesterase class I)